MIVTSLGPEHPAYRMHTPAWSFQPLSGAGAASSSGRLNRKGIDALYLSLETETAIAEYRQEDPLVRPGTLVAYRITIDRVVDFRAGFDAAQWHPLWQHLNCNWKHLAFILGIQPPSWDISDIVRAAGIPGILFPSTRRPGGINLVLYNDLLEAPNQVIPNDPNGQLPVNQSSWQ